MKNKWLKEYPMISCEKADYKKIKSSVGKKLTIQKGEVIHMKHKKIRPIAVAGAILAVSAASIFTVNAATDGAVVDTVREWVQNVTVYINGEEVELPAKVREVDSNGDGYTEFEFEIDDEIEDGENNAFVFEFSEGENGELQFEIPEEAEKAFESTENDKN